MDGLTTLKRIMAECPTPVIMFSVLTRRGARTTVQALMAGAIDFVRKPEANSEIYRVIKDLITKIKTAAGTTRARLTIFRSHTSRYLNQVGATTVSKRRPINCHWSFHRWTTGATRGFVRLASQSYRPR